MLSLICTSVYQDSVQYQASYLGKTQRTKNQEAKISEQLWKDFFSGWNLLLNYQDTIGFINVRKTVLKLSNWVYFVLLLSTLSIFLGAHPVIFHSSLAFFWYQNQTHSFLYTFLIPSRVSTLLFLLLFWSLRVICVLLMEVVAFSSGSAFLSHTSSLLSV